MNNALKQMVNEAEGRFLSDGEVARVRDYAIQLKSRIDAARRLEAAEERIVATAIENVRAKHPEYGKKSPGGGDHGGARDLVATLRYAAAAHVRDDAQFFRVSYASWVADLLRPVQDAAVLVAANSALRASLDEHLDSVDARAFGRYIDIFVDELSA